MRATQWTTLWISVTLAMSAVVKGQDACLSSTTSAALLFKTPSSQCALSPKVHRDQEDRAWEVRLTPGKGRGVFARRDIGKGSHMMVEEPLLSIQLPDLVPGRGYDMAVMVQDVTRQYALLDPQDKEEFDSCHEHRFSDDSRDETGRLMAIFRSNGYTIQGSDGRGRVALYTKTSLINHSCQPNVLNVDTEVKRIIATRDIQAGEEASSRLHWARKHGAIARGTTLTVFALSQILTTYIPLLMDTASRNQRLQQYGFVCGCDACKGQTSDRQRVQAGAELRQLEQAVEQGVSNAQLVQRAESLARYVEAQGFADYGEKTSRLVCLLALLAGDQPKARSWADKYVASQRHIDPRSIGTQRAEQLLEQVG